MAGWAAILADNPSNILYLTEKRKRTLWSFAMTKFGTDALTEWKSRMYI
jgi:hypothetical protein